MYKIGVLNVQRCKIIEKYRPILAEAFRDRKIIQPKNNECIIFHPEISRFKNDGAMYSEPKWIHIDYLYLFYLVVKKIQKN
jgi:hypothetical protein